MTDKTLVLDIDGCLADFVYGFSGLLGRPYSQGKQRTWLFDASKEDVARAWRTVDASKAFWLALPPLVTEPEVSDLVRLARDVRFVYMTGREDRGNETLQQTTRWLKYMGLPEGAVMLESDKVAGVKRIENVIGVLEDRPRNITRLTHANLLTYARDWAYNKPTGTCDEEGDTGACPGAVRVGSIGEFVWEVGKYLETH